jgi:hypothetical protein
LELEQFFSGIIKRKQGVGLGQANCGGVQKAVMNE